MAASRSVLALLTAAALLPATPALLCAQEPPKVVPEPPKADAVKPEAPKDGKEHGPGDFPKGPFPRGGGDHPDHPDRPGFGPGGPGGPGGPDGRPDWGHHGPPPPSLDKEKLPPQAEADRDRAMRELQRLTPEQRQKVWKAVMAVMNLAEDKQTALINSEEERRTKVREQIEQVIKEIGVTDEKKRRFFRSYFEGRRAIEEQLRKEGDERRTALTRELTEKLKKDFGPEAEQQAKEQVVPVNPSIPK